MTWESEFCEACGRELEGESNWHTSRSTPGGEVLDANVDLVGEGPFPVCDRCWSEISSLIDEKGKRAAKREWEPTKPSEE